MLAQRDVAELMWAMDVFAELVGAAGPLCHVRFTADAFAPCVQELKRRLPLDGGGFEDAIEHTFARHATRLGSSAFAHELHGALETFGALPYIDAAHRLAAQAAQAMTPRDGLRQDGQENQAPPLYAIFRAQVRQHFALDGDGSPLS